MPPPSPDPPPATTLPPASREAVILAIAYALSHRTTGKPRGVKEGRLEQQEARARLAGEIYDRILGANMLIVQLPSRQSGGYCPPGWQRPSTG